MSFLILVVPFFSPLVSPKLVTFLSLFAVFLFIFPPLYPEKLTQTKNTLNKLICYFSLVYMDECGLDIQTILFMNV